MPEAVPLDVANSSIHGRGVFASVSVLAGAHLGDWPILRIDLHDPVWGTGSIVEPYVFEMTDGSGAMALGLPALLNHSSTPNCKVELDEDGLMISVYAIESIASGEECLIDYGPDYWA